MKLPQDFINQMKDMLKDEYPEFEKSFLENQSYQGLRITKPSATNLVLDLLDNPTPVLWNKNGYYADKTKISGKHPYHIAGLVYFQEPSAMAPVSALPVNEGDYVLDLCAAPGGKSTQVAEKLMGTGLLVANEIIPKRAEILAENIERCGISNAIVTNEAPDRLSEKFPEFFDKIIVDAPCSGEGMFKKEPQAIDEWSIAHTKTCALRQRHILDCAIKMLKPGGYIVYSTCTFSSLENEDNVSYILSQYENMSLAPVTLEGLTEGFGYTDAKRIFPHKAKGEGHFLALFKKEGEKERKKINIKPTTPPKDFQDFESDAFNIKHQGGFVLFGEHLYLMPEGIDINKIKVIRPGLYMGILKKGRFEPSHSLCLASNPERFKNTISLSADNPSLDKFLHGEEIPCDKSGWTAVLVDGFPIGWGKGSNGILKNHFPKKFRIK